MTINIDIKCFINNTYIILSFSVYHSSTSFVTLVSYFFLGYAELTILYTSLNALDFVWHICYRRPKNCTHIWYTLFFKLWFGFLNVCTYNICALSCKLASIKGNKSNNILNKTAFCSARIVTENWIKVWKILYIFKYVCMPEIFNSVSSLLNSIN